MSGNYQPIPQDRLAFGLWTVESFDPDRQAQRGAGYEQLDQLVIDHILGAR